MHLSPSRGRPQPGRGLLRRTIVVVATALLLGANLSAAERARARPGLRATIQPSPPEWTWRRLPDGPALAGHAAVLTPGDEQVRWVAFGGVGSALGSPTDLQVLRLDGGDAQWTSEQASAPPRASGGGPVRVGARLVLDADEGIAFARCDCIEPAAFLLGLGEGAWQEATTAAQDPLIGGLMAYDRTRDRALHVGGDLLGLGSLVSETVAYDLSSRRAAPRELPPAPFTSIHQAADVDPASGHWLAFGGQSAEGAASTELWRSELGALDSAGAWRQPLMTGSMEARPSSRAGATLTFLGESGLALLFGGYDSAAGERADAWLLDHRDPDAPAWLPLDVAPGADGTPEPRAGHIAAWDPVGERVLLHGGAVVDGRDSRMLGDTWALAQIPGHEAPPPRIFLPRLRRP